jgi:hypothetical protein
MANLYGYFAADDDQTAAATLDDAPDPERFDVVKVSGIEPVVQLGTLEALLRGVPYEQVREDPQQGKLLSSPDAGSRWVVSLTDSLRDALAAATAGQLAEVTVPWSQTEEFQLFGGVDADMLAGALGELAGLAQRAGDRSHHLYCWISL